MSGDESKTTRKILFSAFCEILGKTMYVFGGNGDDIDSQQLTDYFKAQVDKESHEEEN